MVLATKNKYIVGFALVFTCVSACTHDHFESAAILCPSDTISIVSFSNHIQPVFTQYCALSGCHNATDKEGGLNLSAGAAYQNLSQAGSGYIDTGNPRGSLLYSQMRSVSMPMPPTGNLDTCITNLILKWIEQKAPNN